jgi:penicillin amidase
MNSPFVLIPLIALILVVLGGALFLLVYWWRMSRPAPRLDGHVSAQFLDAPAEVLRDKHGVAHLYAQSEADLLRLLGWTHAQDRMWQMEHSRRIANGRLAEVFGSAALDADRFSRIIGFRRLAEEELAGLDDATRQRLQWYVDGVNAFVTTHSGRLAAELNLLRVPPEAWTALDTLAYFKALAWAMSTNWERELNRFQLLATLDSYTAAELEPEYPRQSPIIAEAVGSSAALRMAHTAGLLLSQMDSVRTWLGAAGGADAGIGSNSWVVAPAHSLNRRALLCSDPHLPAQLPNLLYEVHLECPEYAAAGATFPGIPGIFYGHNVDIAWGMASALVDTQDLYVERADPADPTRFLHAGQSAAAQVVEETIQVRHGAPHVERVVITRHGPLLSGFLRSEDAAEPVMPLAVQWAGAAPSHTLRALFALHRADDWASFRAACADWAAPVQAITFADARGNIGYTLAGRIPVREQNLGMLPAPGWDAQHEWRGFIAPDELPHLYNPPSGLIVVANNKIAGDDYPHFLGVEFDPGWRAARIQELLLEKERHTIRDMEDIQQDTMSKYAQAFTPWFTLLRSEDPWEKTALQFLRKWNFRMDTDSAAALVFHHLLAHLLDMVFGDKLGPLRDGYYGLSRLPVFPLHGMHLRAQARLLDIINSNEESFWFADVAKARQRTREELLQEALTRAMRSIRDIHGDSSLRWAWGRAHQVRFTHPLSRARMVGAFFDRGPLPVGGDATSPNQSRAVERVPPGLVQILPAYRQVLEVGVWDRGESVMAGGQSGHALSRLFDDQVTMWREGVYRPMAWSREAVEKAAVNRLRFDVK